MEWSPSFECHVRPDGERVYRIGHELVDEFLEFVVGPGPSEHGAGLCPRPERLLQRWSDKEPARGDGPRT